MESRRLSIKVLEYIQWKFSTENVIWQPLNGVQVKIGKPNKVQDAIRCLTAEFETRYKEEVN